MRSSPGNVQSFRVLSLMALYMSSVMGTYVFAVSSMKYKASLMTVGLKPSSIRVTLRCLKVPVISMVSWKRSDNPYVSCALE